MTVLRFEPPDLDTLIRRHQASIWRYLRVLGCGPADADELTQEAFARLLEGTFEHRSERATLSYLRQAARFLFLQQQEQRAKQVEVAWTDAVDDWFSAECSRDGGESWLVALDHCTGKLRGRARRVMEEFYLEGRSRAAVAERLGMQENGVKTLLQRLRAQLRACIARELNR